MLKAEIKKHVLNFIIPGGTSRGILKSKRSWFIIIYNTKEPDIKGIGECSIIDGLSIDDHPDYEKTLQKIASEIDTYADLADDVFDSFPSIKFGIETALHDLKNKGGKVLFPSDFTNGKDTLLINGLVWMGTPDFMKKQIKTKIAEGYTCIKIKIGAIDFQEEISMIREIRKEYPAEEIMIRLDANGAFSPGEALHKLNVLAKFDIHSIEQPIKSKQIKESACLCGNSPIPIALDEELIGVSAITAKKELLQSIKPQYIILKPSLLGGFSSSQEWIDIANEGNIKWWITSALESNIGLNAIAQWTYTLGNKIFHGLGTGSLYNNNIPSPLFIKGGSLGYDVNSSWELNQINS